MVNSISDKAGIKINDKIMEINGKKMQCLSEMHREGMKQGDYARIKVEREGRILEFNIEIPIIPFRLKEEGERENKKEKKDKNIQL